MPGLMASPGSDLIDTNKQIARTTAVRPLLLARSVTGRRSVAGHRSSDGHPVLPPIPNMYG
jgi:hypothetical protein